MKIIKEIHSEDCFDGNFIKEFLLDKNITNDWIEYLKEFGSITVLDGLETPFYSFDKKFFFTIKGIINQNKIKVIFRRNNMDFTKNLLDVLLENFNTDEKGINRVKNVEKLIIKKIIHD